MNSKEIRVSREQAENLKTLGYDLQCTHCYKDGHERMLDYVPTNYNRYDNAVSAPTIDQAIRWLRENKGAHVYADSSRNWCTWYPVVVPKGGSFDTGTEGFDTHDLAQCAGLDTAIDYVKKQQI